MSRSEARSRNHYRSGGYSSGSREPSGYSQGPAPVERRRFPRSITPEYERPPERDRSRERSRDRYIERDRSRGRSRSPSRSPTGHYQDDGFRFGRHASSRRVFPEPSRVLGVFGLNMRTTELDLQRLFEVYGRIERVVIIYHHITQLSRRFGFVSFSTISAAHLARKKVNGMEFQGRKIRVDYSLTKKAHSPTPGRYMGREKTMRRSYRPGSYGDYSYQGSHDRYNHRERRERDRSADSHDRSYNDRPPNPPSHEDRWDDRREMYPSRSAMRSADSAGNDWRNDESENYK